MEINFTKAVGSGNDFVIIDNRNKVVAGKESETAKKICQRKFSVGADGLLLIENSNRADFRMRIFNPDGSEAEMCGNGARCTALYACHNHIAPATMNFETLAGIIFTEVKEDRIKLKMGPVKEIELDLNITLNGEKKKVHYLVVGVPHTVLIEDSVEKIPVDKWGQLIRFHRQFSPRGTNVDFISVKGKNKINMRTYERGVEKETLACGTGAVASAIIAYVVKKINAPIQVLTQSGEILTVYLGKKEGVFESYLEGKAALVYKGNIEL